MLLSRLGNIDFRIFVIKLVEVINFKEKVLDNGLKVIIHEDHNTPLVAVNLLYKVGSRNELEDRTGFAHLFEHLMFGGSKNAPDFDDPIQLAGGENNAFTNSDITNFYITIPAQNLETALWLESDRMQNLVLDKNALELQRKVVVEEFKETCLNMPYGDVWHHISSLAYKKHPYQWPTIGKDIKHIQDASLEDVASFFNTYYVPNNAVLVLAGKIETDQGFDLAEKWFGDIKSKDLKYGSVVSEPKQIEQRELSLIKDVPSTAVFISFPMPGKKDEDYFAYDMLSDILGSGRSSRLYRKLYKQKKYFSKIDAYVTGTLDPGLLIIESRIAEGIDHAMAIESIWEELDILKYDIITDHEFEKVKNQIISTLEFGEINILNKAMNLAYYASLNNTDLINHQREKYKAVTREDLQRVAKQVFKKEQSNTLIYGPN